MAESGLTVGINVDQSAKELDRRLIRNAELRARGLTDVRAWVRVPRKTRVTTNQNAASPRKRQLNLYLTNDAETRRTAKAAAMLVDRSAANRGIIEAVVTALERSAPEIDGNTPAGRTCYLRPDTLKALAEDQDLAGLVDFLAAMPRIRRVEALALLTGIASHDRTGPNSLRSRLKLAWGVIRTA